MNCLVGQNQATVVGDAQEVCFGEVVLARKVDGVMLSILMY